MNNLAKGISGFGNSEGGVIVWGVDASTDADGADVARLKQPIENIARFVSLLESSVSGRTVPPHPNVSHCGIETGDGKGFVATLIPKSSIAPHQTVPESKYYIRAGSNFVPTPHSVLAGMFGRRPQPEVFATFSYPPARIIGEANTKTIAFSFNFQITNNGPVIARDLYSNVKLLIPKSACTAKFECPEPNDWNARMNLGVWLSSTTKDEFKLAPDSFTTPFRLHLTLSPPFENGIFWVRWTFGCEAAPLKIIELRYELDEVRAMYEGFIAGNAGNEEGHAFVSKFYNFVKQP